MDDSWLTIGAFDGVHQGHREILRKLTAGAHAVGAPAVVLTFFPHPMAVLHGPQFSFYLTTPEEKAFLLAEQGVDVVITHLFNRQLASTSARRFMTDLQAHLGIKQLWVGYDFALGRNREGDVDGLRRLGEEMGYALEVVSPVGADGEVVSSSQIRALLLAGEVGRAGDLLGWPYLITGEVVRGEGRGRKIGVPTANLKVWEERMVPGSGVYACRARLRGTPHLAVANIGVRPTFEAHPVAPRVEAHLLDFEGDLYGQEMELEFLERLRGEVRFPDAEALAAQIQVDIGQAREVLGAGD